MGKLMSEIAGFMLFYLGCWMLGWYGGELLHNASERGFIGTTTAIALIVAGVLIQ